MLPPAFYLLPIPKAFWSEYLSAPFQECIDCGCSLTDSSVYVIQKKFVAGEAIFEMAVCERCREGLVSSYSEETKANLNRRLTEQFEQNAAAQSAKAEETLPQSASEAEIQSESEGAKLLDVCMNRCLFCGIARGLVSRYSLAGLFHHETVVVQQNQQGQSPVMVCDQCERKLIPLISKATRDSWDRFVAEHFDGPPGIEQDSPQQDHPMIF